MLRAFKSLANICQRKLITIQYQVNYGIILYDFVAASYIIHTFNFTDDQLTQKINNFQKSNK